MAQARLGDGPAGLQNHLRAIEIIRASDDPDPEYLAELELEALHRLFD